MADMPLRRKSDEVRRRSNGRAKYDENFKTAVVRTKVERRQKQRVYQARFCDRAIGPAILRRPFQPFSSRSSVFDARLLAHLESKAARTRQPIHFAGNISGRSFENLQPPRGSRRNDPAVSVDLNAASIVEFGFVSIAATCRNQQ